MRDAADHPVNNAILELIREDHPDWSYSRSVDADGEFIVALPAVPFTVQVTAPERRTWRSDTATEVPEHFITLLPQERRRLTITLSSAVR